MNAEKFVANVKWIELYLRIFWTKLTPLDHRFFLSLHDPDLCAVLKISALYGNVLRDVLHDAHHTVC